MLPSKRLIFVLSAFGCAAAGALWLTSSITFQPGTSFSVQLTAYINFMVLVGGILLFALLMPRGIWSEIEQRLGCNSCRWGTG